MNIKKFSNYSPNILRIGVSLVFLWFGINQVLDPDYFISYLPDFILNFSNPANFVIFNGIFEVIFGILLLLGLFTRLVSIILTLHLFGVIFSLGYNEISVRDFGLMISSFVVFLNGKDSWCLDRKLFK